MANSATMNAAAGSLALANAVKDYPATEGHCRQEREIELIDLHFGNWHGLITGQTGTSKTVSLQVLADGCSKAGVSVFAEDLKGDQSGIEEVGEAKPELVKQASDMGLKYQPD